MIILLEDLVPGKVKRKIDWNGINWSKRTSLLARELNLPTTVISRARRRFAANTIEPDSHVDWSKLPQQIDWSKVDWTKSNNELARELNVYDSVVAYKRKRYLPRV